MVKLGGGILVVCATCLLTGCSAVQVKEEGKKVDVGLGQEANVSQEANVTQVTTQKKEDLWPAVSPDGTRVLFSSRQKPSKEIGINYDIWTVDAATHRIFTQITNHPSDECAPAWSPDGKIFFSSPRINDTWAIWRISARTTGAATQITTRDSHDFSPSVSPDGRKIAFTSRDKFSILSEERAGKVWTYYQDGLPYIWIANADGTELTQFGQGITPVWSPDSSKVAFCSNVSGNWDIWVMNADGSGLTQLTSFKSDEVTPAWSPDGRKLAFSSNMAKNFDIWVISLDGGDLTQITYHKKDDCAPVWSPDGRHIYFQSYRSGNWDIWRIASE